jgi:hypothetical protein
VIVLDLTGQIRDKCAHESATYRSRKGSH